MSRSNRSRDGREREKSNKTNRQDDADVDDDDEIDQALEELLRGKTAQPGQTGNGPINPELELILMMGQMMKVLLTGTKQRPGLPADAPPTTRPGHSPAGSPGSTATRHDTGLRDRSTDRSSSSSSSSRRIIDRTGTGTRSSISIRVGNPDSRSSCNTKEPATINPVETTEMQCDRISKAIRASGESMSKQIEQMYEAFHKTQRKQTEELVSGLQSARRNFQDKMSQLMAWTQNSPNPANQHLPNAESPSSPSSSPK